MESQPTSPTTKSESRNDCVVCSRTLVGEISVFVRVSMPLTGALVEGNMHVECVAAALATIPRRPATTKKDDRRIIYPPA